MGKATATKIILIALLAALFALGYFRNYVFVVINAQASAAFYQDTRPVLNGFMKFTTDKSYTYLIHLKWVLTIAFFLIFCFASILTVYTVFKKRLYVGICLVLYGGLFLFTSALVIAGKVFSPFYAQAFNAARDLMHIGQSPFTAVLLLALCYYYKKAARA